MGVWQLMRRLLVYRLNVPITRETVKRVEKVLDGPVRQPQCLQVSVTPKAHPETCCVREQLKTHVSVQCMQSVDTTDITDDKDYSESTSEL